MIVSRRAFLAGGGMALLPLPALAIAAPLADPQPAQPLAVGELWGMPYVARGALGAVPVR